MDIKHKESIVAFLLTGALLLNGCGLVRKSGEKIAETVSDTTPYYESQLLVLGDEYKDSKEYSFSNVTAQYFCDDYVGISVNAEKQGEDGVRFLEIYDYSGDLITQTDLNALEPGKSLILECMGKTNRGIGAILEDEQSHALSIYIIDTDTWEWQKQVCLEASSLKTSCSPKKLFDTDEDFVFTYDWMDGSYFRTDIVRVTDSGEIVYDRQIESKSPVANAELWDGKLIYQDEIEGYYSLNPDTGETENISMPDDIYSAYKYSSMVVPGGKIIAKEGMQIRQYDLENGSDTIVQDLNYTDYNAYNLCDGWLAYAGQERIVILDLSASRNEESGRCKLIVLTKTDTNPHAGKKILEAATIWGMYPEIGEAQKVYNLADREHFVYITTKYDVDGFQVPDYYQGEPTLADIVTMVTDELAVDIRNGTGPDIVFGLGDTTQLDSEAFLVDLYPYIDGNDGIVRADYLENCFGAFDQDGKLYQIPLTMSVLGILTDKKNAPGAKAGFTFDEYKDLVANKCSGVDPINISNNREMYFRLLYCAMQDQFISQNKLNVDNPEFMALAEYVKDNVIKDGYSSEIDSSDAQWVALYDIYYDMLSLPLYDPDVDLYGAPSYDGRGPMVSVFNTIAVTSCSSDYTAAWQFVKTAIGYEVQRSITGSNPINRAALMDYAKQAVKDANKTYKKMYIDIELGENDIDRYVQMLEKADCAASYDTEVYQVMLEELEPYFEGQKDLESVVSIIQDRAQTVLDERG